jgi:hypothetical protein
MKTRESECKCPFCEQEMTHHCAEPEFCQPCGVEFVECGNCKEKFSHTLQKCPKCGTPHKSGKKKS